MRNTQSALLITDQGEIDLEAWLQYMQETFPYIDHKRLQQASVLARLSGEEQATPMGNSCLHLSLAMTETLAEMYVENDILIAALLFSSVRYADLSNDDVEEQFGKTVAELVRGSVQLGKIHQLQQGKRGQLGSTIDNLRKMLLAIVRDIRVVFIQLALRAVELRNCRALSEKERGQLAQETMSIYAPLANRLGVWHLKWQLEDLSFRYIDPKEYKSISKSLKSRRVEREQYVKMVMQKLEQGIEQLGIKKHEISGRAKHIYSIYSKMQRKKLPIEEIYDVIALRVLVPEISDCYEVLSFVHSEWEPIKKEFDDYIAQPKPNGYRSIHTAVLGPEDRHVEIQIRTFAIHEESEVGVAAHWTYKEGGSKKADAAYEEKIALLRNVMDWQKEITESEQASEEIQSGIFDDRVYVFTPNGDVMDLPQGATPLDFAYIIHSEIGHRCRGAKVNGKIVQLTSKLKTGDRVDIITGKEGQPSRDWLDPNKGYLKSTRAKAKVLSYFRKQDHDVNQSLGQDILDKELKRLVIKKVPYLDVAKRLNYHNKDDMLAGLGRGDIRIQSVINAINAEAHIEPEIVEEQEISVAKPLKKTAATLQDIDIQGVGNLLTNMAQCCKPVPGDDIIGYVTLGKGVTIHRSDCANIVNVSKYKQERLLEVSWGSKTTEKYSVDLIIDAYDRQGLVRDLTNLLSHDRIAILGLNYTCNKSNHSARIFLTIEIDSLSPLSKILSRIHQLSNVVDVKRAV